MSESETLAADQLAANDSCDPKQACREQGQRAWFGRGYSMAATVYSIVRGPVAVAQGVTGHGCISCEERDVSFPVLRGCGVVGENGRLHGCEPRVVRRKVVIDASCGAWQSRIHSKGSSCRHGAERQDYNERQEKSVT